MGRRDRLLRPPGAAAYLDARRIVALGMFWPFLLLAVALVPLMQACNDSRAATLVLVTVLLGIHALGSMWAARARSTATAVGRTFVVHGALVWAGAAGTMAIKEPSVLLAGLVGLAIAYFTTPLLCAVHGVLVAVASSTLRRAGYDSRERVIVANGLLIAAIGSLWPLASLRHPEQFGTFPVVWTVLAVGAPLAGVAWGLWRQHGWRVWLKAVEAGQVAGWAIVDDVPDRTKLVPVLAPSRWPWTSPPARVLVWTQPTASPFRESEIEVPVALVRPGAP